MHIFAFEPQIIVVGGQLLSHLFGQDGDEHALPTLDDRLHTIMQVFDLIGTVDHFDLGVEQSGRAYHLLRDDGGELLFELIGGGGDEEIMW